MGSIGWNPSSGPEARICRREEMWMRQIVVGLLLASVVVGMTTNGTEASRPETSFQRVGTFANYRNNGSRADDTVSEITPFTATPVVRYTGRSH
jgi:hypothetical protein